jgi:hypothetical protein
VSECVQVNFEFVMDNVNPSVIMSSSGSSSVYGSVPAALIATRCQPLTFVKYFEISRYKTFDIRISNFSD